MLTKYNNIIHQETGQKIVDNSKDAESVVSTPSLRQRTVEKTFAEQNISQTKHKDVETPRSSARQLRKREALTNDTPNSTHLDSATPKRSARLRRQLRADAVNVDASTIPAPHNDIINIPQNSNAQPADKIIESKLQTPKNIQSEESLKLQSEQTVMVKSPLEKKSTKQGRKPSKVRAKETTVGPAEKLQKKDVSEDDLEIQNDLKIKVPRRGRKKETESKNELESKNENDLAETVRITRRRMRINNQIAASNEKTDPESTPTNREEPIIENEALSGKNRYKKSTDKSARTGRQAKAHNFDPKQDATCSNVTFAEPSVEQKSNKRGRKKMNTTNADASSTAKNIVNENEIEPKVNTAKSDRKPNIQSAIKEEKDTVESDSEPPIRATRSRKAVKKSSAETTQQANKQENISSAGNQASNKTNRGKKTKKVTILEPGDVIDEMNDVEQVSEQIEKGKRKVSKRQENFLDTDNTMKKAEVEHAKKKKVEEKDPQSPEPRIRSLRSRKKK